MPALGKAAGTGDEVSESVIAGQIENERAEIGDDVGADGAGGRTITQLQSALADDGCAGISVRGEKGQGAGVGLNQSCDPGNLAGSAEGIILDSVDEDRAGLEWS